MVMKEIIKIFALCFVLTSCQSNTSLDINPDQESSSSSISDDELNSGGRTALLGEPFLIAEKDSVLIQDDSRRLITFTKVVEDSLCPYDLNCFRWGNMVIQVQIDDQFEELSIGDLNLPKEATFGNLKVTLLDLNFPLMQDDKADMNSVYVVSLQVTKAN